MAALKELKACKGTVDVNGTTAYVAQQPWIFSGTVQQNILFGKEYNKKKYTDTIKACALLAVCHLILILFNNSLWLIPKLNIQSLVFLEYEYFNSGLIQLNMNTFERSLNFS